MFCGGIHVDQVGELGVRPMRCSVDRYADIQCGKFFFEPLGDGERRVMAVLQPEDDLDRRWIVLGAKGGEAFRKPGFRAVKRLQDGDRLWVGMRLPFRFTEQDDQNSREKIKATEACESRAYAGNNGCHYTGLGRKLLSAPNLLPSPSPGVKPGTRVRRNLERRKALPLRASIIIEISKFSPKACARLALLSGLLQGQNPYRPERLKSRSVLSVVSAAVPGPNRANIIPAALRQSGQQPQRMRKIAA